MRILKIALSLVALLVTVSCENERPDTLIRLVIDSDLEVGTELAKLEVRIFDREGKEELRRQDFALGEKREGTRYALPLSIKLAPESQRSSVDFRVVVAGIGPVGPGGSEIEVVEQQALASFRPGEALRLDIFLARSCLLKLCGKDEDELSNLTCDVETGACGDVPTREALPTATGDGVRQRDVEEGDAGVVGGPADATNDATADSSAPEILSGADAASDSGTDAGIAVDATVGISEGGLDASASLPPAVEIDNCKSNPCGSPNTCIDVGNDFSCKCATNYLQASAKRCVPKSVRLTTRDRTCTQRVDGTGVCWGALSPPYRPLLISGVSNSQGFAVGETHTCAISGTMTFDQVVFCWGMNLNGQLGNGTFTRSTTPVAVLGLMGVISIGAGRAHTCVSTTEGQAYCWGANAYGQLGSGAVQDSDRPTVVASLSVVQQVVTGALSSCARLGQGGTVACWGGNFNGELGDGTFTNSPTPIAVPGLVGVAQLASGFSHVCAILVDGTATCWGRNQKGQVGAGTTGNSYLEPHAVGGLTQVVEIAPGAEHTCARTRDFRVFCWGANDSGQFGDGTADNSSKPVEVTSSWPRLAGISCGGSVTCGLTVDGNVVCAGSNLQGELGDGTNLASRGPVAVLSP